MDDSSFPPIPRPTWETSESQEADQMHTHTHTQTQTAPKRKPVRDSSASTSQTSRKLHSKGTTSTISSANPSREHSPARTTRRSRKNNTQDLSPARPTNPPSAAATQRALSAASIPIVSPIVNSPPSSASSSSPSEPSIKTSLPQKAQLNIENKENSQWPISPRLKSPPPLTRPSILSQCKLDQELQTANAHNISHSLEEENLVAAGDSDAEELQLASLPGMRTPARGVSGASTTLETVQEISQPGTPTTGLDGALDKLENVFSTSTADQDNLSEKNLTKKIKAKSILVANESGSDSGGGGGREVKIRAAAATTPLGAPRSNGPPPKPLSSGGVGRGKPTGEGSTRNMTVETETVSSIPQVAVGAGPGNNGSIRTKPSSETIRPKREKKKTTRKAPAVTSGTVSSKADIFEAKVASAVDEANSSDSEETFVYESNPPDANERPRRFHSRTPSATSMASQVDQRNGIRATMDGYHTVAMKKSMKFANTYNSTGPDSTTGDEDGNGTARSNVGTGTARSAVGIGRGGTSQHHHFNGRWGRHGGGNRHPSLFDNESLFPNAAKSRLAATGTRISPSPTSPRVPNMRMAGNGKKFSPAVYDLEDVADDERTPLMQSVRSNRSTRSRRQTGSVRQLEHQVARHSQPLLSRFSGCLVLSLMIFLVISGAIGFMFATTQPLSNVKVLSLKNVLASEQDIIFDMKVQARNPNIVAVTVDFTDLVVFAKSSYAGSDSQYRQRRRISRRMRHGLRLSDTPHGEVPGTSPNLEIGHVYRLDSPLTFEGSPFQDGPAISAGQISIKSPGNRTVPSGSERWGNVLQHEFDLIVRGTLKYTLPLSQKLRVISVEGRATVKPNAADRS